MEPDARRIEIFAPFGAAMDWTKLILFQPFDITKWLIIGFAAFLANLGGGGFGNVFNYTSKPGKGDWTFRSVTHDALGTVDLVPGWLLAVIGILALLIIAIVVALTWVSARGKFIFTDCVVRNRAAIVEPWHEFRREGNSFFLFSLGVGAFFIIILALAGFPLWWPFIRFGEAPEGLWLILGLIFLAVFFLFALAWGMIASFISPIMYRRRCGAMQALRESFELVMSQPGPVILFFLFSLVLVLVTAIVSCVATCVTCCIAALPYIGTVILLPLLVFWKSYQLLFLRQFGANYDTWANVIAALPAAPPIQTAPPPTPEPPPSLPL